MENDRVQQVAFFRNVNQGQRGMPRTADLLDAFHDADVPDATAFQSNGTVVFTTPDPAATLADVRSSLMARGSAVGEIYTRPILFIRDIVSRYRDHLDAGRFELTLFQDRQVIVDEARMAEEAHRRRCEIVDHGPGWAVVSNERERQSNGTPTIEAALPVHATSRGFPTLERLVERLGS